MLKKFMRSTVVRRACAFVTLTALTMVLLGAQSPKPSAPAEEAPANEAVAAEANLDQQVLLDGFVIPKQDEESDDAEYPGLFLFTEQEAEDEAEAEVTVDPEDGFVYLETIPISHELQRYTYERCEELDLDYPLILAIMWRESRFQVDVVNVNRNGTRDSGLMQINDVNRDWLRREHGIVDLMDPVQNINAGTAMLAGFMEKYSETQALMAYQYGEQGMLSRSRRGVTTNELTRLVQQKRDEFAIELAQAAQQL